MTMPLDGVRVIDWTVQQQGPVASLMLGDLGAEVIKIEERLRGDPGRGLTGIMGLRAMAQGRMRNFYFEANNRNKKGITLDLKKEKAREVVYRLVEKSDVFVQNFRQGVAERLGLGYDTLSKFNPKLIYATASGYGPQGPDSAKPSIDPAAMARSGMMSLIAPADMPPHYIPGGIADQMGAIMLAYGIVVALLARERLGVGQRVDASHIASMMWLQSLNMHQCLFQGREPPKFNRERAGNPLHNLYRCADGKWLFMGLSQPERFWPDFCRALGIEDLEKDPRFESMDKRHENSKELVAILDERFATRTSSEWVRHLSQFSDFIFEPVNTLSDLVSDPQVLANDYIVEFPHPSRGPTKMLGVPVRLSRTPGSIRLPAPEFGQHTEEVLLEVCGYTWKEISEMKDQEVI
jgi:crotonobetainyl-CoA:carnitine CoA-transferase CaiB-like acyl-CoA transferase